MDEGLSSGTPLPPEHHVGKHCQPRELIQEEREDGSLESVGVSGKAFIPDNDGVSVAWMEHSHHSGNQALVINCLKGSRTIRKSHRLAVYSVGTIIICGAKFGKSISINFDPQPGFDCHSLVVGIDPESPDLLDLIAAELLALEAMVA